MQTKIHKLSFPDSKRILMTSDIHGHATGLEALLKKAGFNEQDMLVIVGDIVEKGPESLKTLRLIMKLVQSGNTYAMLGNVDLWRLEHLLSEDTSVQQELLNYSLKASKWWSTSFLGELCQEIGVTLSAEMNTQDVFRRLRIHFKEEFSFLANLPTILETQRMIFVHGGIPHENVDTLAETDCYPLLKRDHFLLEGHSFQKYVVVGHWPVALYCKAFACHNPIIDEQQHIICLDGGCGLKEDGQLNLLAFSDWKSDAFTLYTWDDMPVITAIDAQEASEKSCYIPWERDRPQVTVLEQNQQTSRILFNEPEMEIPSDFIFCENEISYVHSISDYHLEVHPGDRLSLVFSHPYGSYVKKDGIVGWYKGRSQQENAGRF